MRADEVLCVGPTAQALRPPTPLPLPGGNKLKEKKKRKKNMPLLELFYCFSLQLCVVSILKTIEIDMLNNCMKEQPAILEVKLRQF